MVDLAKIRKKAKGKPPGEPASLRVDEPSGALDQPALPEDDSAARRLADSTTQAGRGEVAPRTDNREPAPATAAPQTTSNPQPATNVVTTDKLERFKAEAGKRRDAIKKADAEDAPQSWLELLTFLIAGEQYAIEIERIVEIVPSRPVTRIPNADPSVVGIISLRGTIVTLVDVRRRLGHPEGAGSADTRLVVIDYRNETIGFAVDRVLRVVKLAAAEVEPHPVVHATELEASVRGVVRASGALTIFLDLDKLIDSTAFETTPWT